MRAAREVYGGEDNLTGEITDRASVRQVFMAEYSTLVQVDICFATYLRDSRGGVVTIEIVDVETRKLVHKKNTRIDSIFDNKYYQFELYAVLEKGQRYELAVKSNVSSGKAITAKWGYKFHKHSTLIANGKILDGELACVMTYQCKDDDKPYGDHVWHTGEAFSVMTAGGVQIFADQSFDVRAQPIEESKEQFTETTQIIDSKAQNELNVELPIIVSETEGLSKQFEKHWSGLRCWEKTIRHLVTGNAGFMGSWIADMLLLRGESVFGIDNLSGGFESNINPSVGFHKWDLSASSLTGRSETLDSLIDEINPDFVWHLAADATEGRSQFTPVSALYNNVVAYMNMLSSCIKCWKRHGGIQNKKLVLFSSMSIYGKQRVPFDECDTRIPVDVYGGSKAYMEQITEALADVHEFRHTIIRPHNVFGPRQKLNDPYRNVVAIFINRVMHGEHLTVYGDGHQRRAFSYICNSMPCYLRCLDESTDGQIYNIGGMRDISIKELAEIVLDAMGSEVPVVHVPDRPREVKAAYSTYAKSIRELGYSDEVSIEDGVRLMVEWAKGLGPQEWQWKPLEIDSEKAPEVWRQQRGLTQKPI